MKESYCNHGLCLEKEYLLNSNIRNSIQFYWQGIYADTNNIYDQEPGNICYENRGSCIIYETQTCLSQTSSRRDCQIGVYCGRTKLCNKLLLKHKCLYAISDQSKYIERSAYQIMISELVSFCSCYCDCSSYKNCSLPVMTEVMKFQLF